MATIKSFTDIQQSKKLAEILPPESADHFHIIGRFHTDGPRYEVIRSRNEVVETDKYWPCWSLAALLDVLPHRINDRYALVSGKLTANEGWYVCYDDDNGDIDYYFHNSNLIDACYEMILKLHEQKVL